jgi:hypothetical protein
MDTVELPVKAEASALRGLRVLIVEDSYVVARAIQSLLEEIGMSVSALIKVDPGVLKDCGPSRCARWSVRRSLVG